MQPARCTRPAPRIDSSPLEAGPLACAQRSVTRQRCRAGAAERAEDATRRMRANDASTLRLVRTGSEVAVFVTRRNGAEVLIVHRSPVQGGYWHVVAGGAEAGEDPEDAARRELEEETSLVARVSQGPRVVEYVYPSTEEPADRRDQYDPSVVAVMV